MNHLDDDAELYALGLTNADDAAAIEAHLRDCAECRERVARAEHVAASLAAALPAVAAVPAQRRTRPWWTGLAVAAAIVFAATAAIEGAAAHSASVQLQRTDVALIAMASSHFGHTTMTAEPGVVAKMIYARDAAWCYVVVAGAPRGAHVVVRRGTAAQDMGQLDGATPATLFMEKPGRPSAVEIVAGDHIVAQGSPVF